MPTAHALVETHDLLWICLHGSVSLHHGVLRHPWRLVLRGRRLVLGRLLGGMHVVVRLGVVVSLW